MFSQKQYYKFSAYGFLKNLRFFDAFLLLFLVDKGLSYTQIGVLYALREVVINVFEVPSGLIADSYGRKNALLLSFILYIDSFLLFYFANDFWWFLLAFGLYGVADAFRSGTHKGMIMDYLKLHDWQSHKINYYGHTRSWSQKGSALSSLIAGLIVYFGGDFKLVFLYSIVPYVVNLFVVASYPNNINHANKPEQRRIGLTSKTLITVLKQAEVVKLINSAALHTAYLKAIKDYIQPLIVHVAVLIPLMSQQPIEKKNGLIIGVIYFFIYLGTSRASRMASVFYGKNKIKSSNLTLLLGFALGLLSGLFYLMDLWVFALLLFVGVYLVENLRKPILTGIISDNVPNEILTSVLSVQSLVKTVMTALIALSLGILADSFGIAVAFICVSSALLLLVLLLNYALKVSSKVP